MQTRFLFAFAVLAMFAASDLARAQEIQLASHAELSDVYTRLANLESQLATQPEQTPAQFQYADEQLSYPGYEGGAEILWLKTFNSGGNFGDFNYDAAFRFWAGYYGAGGFGARIRYFDFQNRTTTFDLIDISALDFELYERVQIGYNWDLYLGGGLRYLDYVAGSTGDGFLGSDITGVGPVVSAELYRHFDNNGAFYAIGRQSIVVGDGHFGSTPVTDLTNYVTELQLGLQFHRDVNAGLLFARFGWEAQWYLEPDGNNSAVMLMGGVLSVGLMR